MWDKGHCQDGTGACDQDQEEYQYGSAQIDQWRWHSLEVQKFLDLEQTVGGWRIGRASHWLGIIFVINFLLAIKLFPLWVIVNESILLEVLLFMLTLSVFEEDYLFERALIQIAVVLYHKNYIH